MEVSLLADVLKNLPETMREARRSTPSRRYLRDAVDVAAIRSRISAHRSDSVDRAIRTLSPFAVGWHARVTGSE